MAVTLPLIPPGPMFRAFIPFKSSISSGWAAMETMTDNTKNGGEKTFHIDWLSLRHLR
jgi:hypothetical protein